MRETDYASEVITAAVNLGDGQGEARLELLFIKNDGEERIRLSWWKDGQMVPRPLELTERQLTLLLTRAVQQGALLREER